MTQAYTQCLSKVCGRFAFASMHAGARVPCAGSAQDANSLCLAVLFATWLRCCALCTAVIICDAACRWTSLQSGLSWDTLNWTMAWLQKPSLPTCVAMTPAALLMLLRDPRRSVLPVFSACCCFSWPACFLPEIHRNGLLISCRGMPHCCSMR